MPPEPRHATKAQRVALLVGLAVAVLAVLQLFASILLPFVVAAASPAGCTAPHSGAGWPPCCWWSAWLPPGCCSRCCYTH
jgi:hypothetical protein